MEKAKNELDQKITVNVSANKLRANRVKFTS